MFRHSNSFLLSLFLHLLLVGVLLYSYKTFDFKKSETKESRVPIKLCCIVSPTFVEKKALFPEVPNLMKKNTQKRKKELPKKKKKVIAKKKVEKKLVVTLKKAPKLKPIIIEEKKFEKKVVQTKSSPPKSVKKMLPTVVQIQKKPSPEKSYIDNNLQKIVTLLQENLYYPRRARKRGIEGDVMVKFTLSKDAVVSSIEVLSSKSDILSRGAIKTIENLSNEFPKPQERLTLTLPISYSLR